MPLLSVIVPVYNEAKTIRQILAKINAVDIDKEIVLVDDGSCDGTEKILRDIKYNNLKIIYHSSNRGKGAAFLTGLTQARGEFIIIQDADLEYEPNDYLKLMEAIKEDKADIVLGARFKEGYHGLFIHKLGNRFLTGLLNLLFHIRLNDCFSCYKLFRRDTISMLNLKEQSFTIEIEIVAKAAKAGLRIIEIPIAYHPRTYAEGKKIRAKDGIRAIGAILKYRLKG
ncbi:MAG: glycosyltransferase family 2 protein [Candidatus Omnitrophica bacterium]|nr:glycosyltransferase family 2 protein [Candidatus Omnitrophota bacterium]